MKTYPATEGAAPVLAIPNPPPEPDPEHLDKIAASDVISTRRSYPSTDGAAPIFEPIAIPAVPQTIDRWLANYPNQIERRQLHVAQIPHAPTWTPETPFDEEAFPWIDFPDMPIFRRGAHAAYMPVTRTNPPYQVRITPDMWSAQYPTLLSRPTTRVASISPASFFVAQEIQQVIPRMSAWSAIYPDFALGARRPAYFESETKAFENPENIIPKVTEWQGQYADFARATHRRPYLNPFNFQYELVSPNLALEVSSWTPVYPDFVLSKAPIHHLVPSMWWYEITGPDVIPPVSFMRKLIDQHTIDRIDVSLG